MRLSNFLRTAAAVALLLSFGVVDGALASASGVDTTGALPFGGLDRTYVLHVPAGVEQPAGLVINLHGAGMTRRRTGVVDELQRRRRPAWVRGGVPGRDRPELGRRSWRIDARPPRRRRRGFPGGARRPAHPRLRHRAGQRLRDGTVGRGVHGDAAGVPARRRRRRHRAGRRVSLGSAVPCAPSRPVSVFATHGISDPVVPYNGGGMVGRGGPSDIVAPQAMAGRWRDLDHCPSASGRGCPQPGGAPLHVLGLRRRHRSRVRPRRRRRARVVRRRIGRQRTILRHPRQVSSSR